MFTPCTEKRGTAYFEFQYCKKEAPLEKLVKNGYGHWEADSLLVHMDSGEEFFKHYREYLEAANAPDGANEFCYYGVNYYTREQTEHIITAIRKDLPKGCETIVGWLEKALTEYNGFYFLGI